LDDLLAIHIEPRTTDLPAFLACSGQKPFAIVIVAGLVSRLFLGFFVNPVLYEMVAKNGDVLQV
jgi:multidrug efflux pump subunit AcrB